MYYPRFIAFVSCLSVCFICTGAEVDHAVIAKKPVVYDQVRTAQTAFGIAEVRKALTALMTDGMITVSVDAKRLKEQAYEIKITTKGNVTVVGGDSVGAMYGLFDLAEQLSLEQDWNKIKEKECAPFIEKRGIKFNIPFDARMPSYDDTGDAAQHNIAEMWNREFWYEYLDALALKRYNVLSLWTKHPFPCLIKLKDYPNVALADVYAFNGELTPKTGKDWDGVDLMDPKNLKLVKRMPIEEKIAFWQDVMQYAHDRGIEIYFFTWNIFVDGAEEYGIKSYKESAVSYMRLCVRTLLETYPLLAGFGVTAGERMGATVGPRTNIEWLRDTYGRGVADVIKASPEREFRFIFRRHHTNLASIDRDFKPHFPGKVETSFKYSFAHMYSTPTPPRFDKEYADDVRQYGYTCWMNLRNDDIFTFRWGDPDYVRDYLTKMSSYPIAGFYIGSDGYVWGREFTSKNAKLSGELEIAKHWYREMLWGRLAYDPSLDREFFIKTLGHRFPEVDAEDLYAAWQIASTIIPTVNNFHWKGGDSMWAVEGCFDDAAFHTVRDFINSVAFEPTKIMTIPDYADVLQNGKNDSRQTPVQIADQLLNAAEQSLELVGRIKDNDHSPALQETVSDIEAMAFMGRYYGHKIKGATYLYLYEITEREMAKTKLQSEALNSMEQALSAWKQYARNADSRYRVQLLARTQFLDWNRLIKHAEEDIQIVKDSTGKPPKIAKIFFREILAQCPEKRDELISVLKELGYKEAQLIPAWMMHGHVTGYRICIFKEGDISHEEFTNYGGQLPDDFKTKGYAIVEHHNVIWICARNSDLLSEAVSEFMKSLKKNS